MMIIVVYYYCVRHGIRQLRNPWADGPDFVTQCPILPGRSYTYRFTIQNQEGTLWWHAHSKWLRATVYGALIIYPKLGSTYPFAMPKREIPILLGNPSFISIYTNEMIIWQRQNPDSSDVWQGSGGTGIPWMSLGWQPSRELNQMFPMLIPSTVNWWSLQMLQQRF